MGKADYEVERGSEGTDREAESSVKRGILLIMLLIFV